MHKCKCNNINESTVSNAAMAEIQSQTMSIQERESYITEGICPGWLEGERFEGIRRTTEVCVCVCTKMSQIFSDNGFVPLAGNNSSIPVHANVLNTFPNVLLRSHQFFANV